MKTLVFGDIHGRDCWIDIIQHESPDKVIFLGDYVSTHDDIDEHSQITNLERILDYKELNMGSTILLRGNHDMQHLGYSWARCSGLFPKVMEHMSLLHDRFLSLTQWIYVDGDLLFSHAGVSEEWMNIANVESVEEINNIEPCEHFGFLPSYPGDYNGSSPSQPPTWIRPAILAECAIPQYTQIVGHTPIHPISTAEVKYQDYDLEHRCTIWLCDNLPNQYLTITDGKFAVKNIN